MFGTLRFVLALMVVIEHFYLTDVIHPGAIAVICFYMLAGYVMAHAVQTQFGVSAESVRKFYLDRILRIFPLYWIVSIAILVTIWIIKGPSISLKPGSVLGTALLFPLNYWMYTPSFFSINGDSFPIPPAPSLALELHFYLICPWLIRHHVLRLWCLALSLVFFAAAGLGFINTYYWGYCLLPGTLFTFIGGILIYELHSQNVEGRAKAALSATTAILVFLFAVLAAKGLLDRPHSLEVIVGFLLASLSILILGKIKVRSAIDQILGEMSYPLFVSHFLIIYAVDTLNRRYGLGWNNYSAAIVKLPLILLVALVITRFIDAPLQRWRRRIKLLHPIHI